jgi:hypothetical protein
MELSVRTSITQILSTVNDASDASTSLYKMGAFKELFIQRIRLTTLPPSMSRLSKGNVGASTSHNLVGLYGLLQG